MAPLLSLLPSALSDLYVQASLSGTITLADRYGLLAALLDESMGDEERLAIDRMIWAVRKGRMKLTDELSAVS